MEGPTLNAMKGMQNVRYILKGNIKELKGGMRWSPFGKNMKIRMLLIGIVVTSRYALKAILWFIFGASQWTCIIWMSNSNDMAEIWFTKGGWTAIETTQLDMISRSQRIFRDAIARFLWNFGYSTSFISTVISRDISSLAHHAHHSAVLFQFAKSIVRDIYLLTSPIDIFKHIHLLFT